MRKIQIQSFENSSVVLKFHIFFVVLSLIPLGILLYLYFEIKETGQISIAPEELNTTLIIAVIGIISGYFAMRVLLKNLVDVTKMSADGLKGLMGPDKIQEFLKGNDNEIAVLTRTFREITSRLEENVSNLETTKKTLQSVLTRVGQGISSLRNIDTFLDLIVETMTEALSGKKGFLLVIDQEKKALVVKTVYGASLKNFDKKYFSLETSPFAPAFNTRTALIVPKMQYLSKEGAESVEALDFPMMCAPLLLHGEVLGVMAVSGRRMGSTFQEEEMALLLNLATQTAIAIENSELNLNADKTYFETLAALAMAVEAKDSYSRGHLDRVGQYCVQIAQNMGIEPLQVGYLRDAARIHDVGKIGVTDDVLSKPAPLNEQEWIMMKRHPEIGESIIKPISSLQPLCDIIRHHHEKLDGTGYPDKLQGDQIGLSVRILTVADMYDALTTNRPYRKALSHRDAEKVLRDMAGAVDQKVVDVLLEVVSKS